MKFCRALEFNCVPEWREKYVAYRSLKKLVEQITCARVELVVEQDNNSEEEEKNELAELSAVVIMSYRDGIELEIEQHSGAQQSLMEHLVVLETTFSKLFREELFKVNEFYIREKISCMERWDSLVSELFTNFSGPKQRVRRVSFDEVQIMSLGIQTDSLPSYTLHASSHVNPDIIKSLYLELYDLRDFLQLNYEGFSKIIKKHDKHSGTGVKHILQAEVELALPQTDLQKIQNTLEDLEKIYAQMECEGRINVAHSQLQSFLRERLILSRSTVWQDMVAMERQVTCVSVIDDHDEPSSVVHHHVNVLASSNWGYKMAFILTAFFLIWLTPILPDSSMNSALALCVLIISFWATEIIPLFATAILVPLLVVFLGVLKDPLSGSTLDAATAASVITSSMFSQVTLMLLGGFTLAAAVTKYGLARHLACKMLALIGQRNNTLVLGVMTLALVSSSLISNVAAPVLCFSLLQPLIRSLPGESALAKQLVLAVAVASNIGGMASPISSPQNIIAIERMSLIAGGISWPMWFAISLPVCSTSLVLCWFVICYGFPESKPVPSSVFFYTTPLAWGCRELTVIFTTALAIAMWCSGLIGMKLFGNMGMIALIPMVIFFGSGILGKDDFNSFPWTVVMLAMGGAALGEAVRSSGLLGWMANSIVTNSTTSPSMFGQVVFFSIFITIATSFVSHTVSALIFIPMVQAIGEQLSDPHPRLLMMTAALACSAGMVMPISSFPNIAATNQEDGAGRPYLPTREFIRLGLVCSTLVCFVVVVLGYGLMRFLKL